MRSYGTAAADSTVFLELKKKFGGVVYKRRAAMTLAEAEGYLRSGIKPFESQIMSEIDWAMRLYGRPKGAMMIACEREAWFDEEHPDLRLTFDRNIRYRETELRLDSGSAGINLLPENTVLLEIKTAGRAGCGRDPSGQLLQIRRRLHARSVRKETRDFHDGRGRQTCRQFLVPF